MDPILCDELLQEIFHRLPPSSSSAVSLVSKRWLRLLRSSTTSLSLDFTFLRDHPNPSISNFLCSHPYLSSLSVFAASTTSSSDHLLFCVSSSCPNLRRLKFLAGSLSALPLLSLSTSCAHLSALTISLSRPLSFHWLTNFGSLKLLSLIFTGNSSQFICTEFDSSEFDFTANETRNKIFDSGLNLESLCLTGIKAGDLSLNWLWRNCKKLKTLKLQSCEGVGDNASFSYFIKCLRSLQEVELRKSRSIVSGVLSKLADDCGSLKSLLVYDGGSRESLLQFIHQSRCNIQKIDLRLPLDLDNNHLTAMADNFSCLTSLRLQSCCLVTGEGLKTLGRAMGDRLEELALISCDVVDKESGLLTALGQCFKRLRKLDLSNNEMLVDKEISSMLVSCVLLSDLKLKGCNRLTNAGIEMIAKSCKQLQSVDITGCRGIGAEAVEMLVLNSPQLREVEVEQSKLSNVARAWALNNLIKVAA